MLLSIATWLPYIYCNTYNCFVKPKSKYIPIRNLQKENPIIIKTKIERLIDGWNKDNPMIATEGIELDFIEISKTPST